MSTEGSGFGDSGRVRRLLLALYFSQGLPGGFLAVVLPVVLRREHLSYAAIGLASWLSLPWVLRVVWAPLIDRFGGDGPNRRKRFLLPAQIGMIAVTLACALVPPTRDLALLMLLFFVLNVVASTQDVATDGLAVDLLRGRELGPGNAVQVAGFKLGNIVGGGVLLALLPWLGWSADLAVMAGLLAIAFVLTLRFAEPAVPRPAPDSVRGVVARLWAAIAAEGPWLWLFFVFAKFGETVGGAMIRPHLTDRGFTDTTIGLVDGTFGGIATAVGALGAGLAVQRWGWRRVLVIAAAGQGLMLVVLGWYLAGPIDPIGFGLRSGLEAACGGGVAVAVFALAMGRCDRAVGAAHFTAAQVIYMGGSALAGPVAGALGDGIGVPSTAMVGGVLAGLLALVGLRWARRWDDP